MIFAQDYEEVLRNTGREFFITGIRTVSNLLAWSKERGVDLSEPSQPMKLVTEGDSLILFVQSDIPDEMLDNVITAMSMRWSLKDNVSEPSLKLNSIKKRLAFCLLKECARTVGSLAGNEHAEDEWSMKEMERLGFFLE